MVSRSISASHRLEGFEREYESNVIRSPESSPRQDRVHATKSWFSQAVNMDMAKEFASIRDDITVACSVRGFEEDEELEGHDDDRSIVDDEQFYESYEERRDDVPDDSRCACDFKLPIHTSCTPPPGDNASSHSSERNGMDNIFEFVEVACCGDYKWKQRNASLTGGKGLTLGEITSCKNLSHFRQCDGTEDYLSNENTYQYSSRSHRSSRDKSSSARGRTSDGTDTQHSRQRRLDPDYPYKRNSKNRPRTPDEIAEMASDFIRKNVKPMDAAENQLVDVHVHEHEPANENGGPLIPIASPTSVLSGKQSAFDDPTSTTAASTAVASNVGYRSTPTMRRPASSSEMKDVRVLSILGSGSSVSSFDVDGGGHSWSQHAGSKGALFNSSLSATILSFDNQGDEITVEDCRRAVECVINFLSSLSYSMYGNGRGAPVNKTVCLFAMMFVAIFWPVCQESRRRVVEKVEIPRAKSPVSLLKAVLRRK